MPLLTWSSLPILLIIVWALVEGLPLIVRRWRTSRAWKGAVWSLRPAAIWGAYNALYRYFESSGFNDRTTFPFAFVQWHENDGWMACLHRFITSPAFWIGSATVLLLGLLFVVLCHWILSTPMTGGRPALALAGLVLLNIAMPMAYNYLPEGAEDPLEHTGSFLHAWFDSGNTMLYCMPHIPGKSQYLKHFGEIQPRLKASIHGVTHPPGASLALYWLGKPFGATQSPARDRLRYMLGTTMFAALAVVAMFILGRVVSGSTTIGLMAACLWAIKPATLAYNTFAPDPVYTVFDILCLALIWIVATAPARPWISLPGLGLVLYVLMMLNFNWILFAGLFALFLALQVAFRRLDFRDGLLRAMVPALISGGLLLWTCLTYHLDYLALFRYSLAYTHGFYTLTTPYQWFMALLGGPLDLFLLCGSLTAFLFWRMAPVAATRFPSEPLMLFLISLLAVYWVTAISVNILKMESSRVWAWVTALPLVFVARYLHRSDQPRFYFLMAVIVAMLQYYVMQLFLTPCG